MSGADTNSIRYPKAVDEKLEKLSRELKKSKKEVFCQMVDYFYRSKKDPSDRGDELLKKEISSGISRILSFIRQQEKDFLLPVFSDMGILKTTASRQAELTQGIGKHLLGEQEKTAVLLTRSEQLLKGLKFLVSVQQDKEKLKVRFSELLEYYITRREEMGWKVGAAKKEELMNQVRRSLKNL